MTGLRRTRRISAVMLATLLVFTLGAPATAKDISESKGFRKAVTVAGIREHQLALQGFADAFGGNRVSGGAGGYDASAQYVYDTMTAAGYNVSFQEFIFPYNADRTPPIFQQLAPDQVTYVDGVQFSSMTYSPNGDDAGNLIAVDINFASPLASTSGCTASDYAGFPVGEIALVQRGGCTFAVKSQVAAAAGAGATVVFNNQAGQLAGTLSEPQTHSTPIIGTLQEIGNDLANGVANGDTGADVRVRVDRINENRPTRNVIAETPDGDPDRVVVVGAHLDSVPRGPGINDNGSGSAALLEIAQVYAEQGRESRNKLRFMWFGAEEFGLLGSRHYVSTLSQEQRDDIELMINFDMVGSPNYVRFVYDGDNSMCTSTPPATGCPGAIGPPGSAYIESVFVEYFNSQRLANEPTLFSGRSDYGPFITAGIPAGGLFTGAEGIKTTAQATTYGGTAGTQYDPCYHLACDTFAGTGSGAGATSPGLGVKALDEMSDAMAHAVLTFARTKVNVAQTQATTAIRSSGSPAQLDFGPETDDDRVSE